jgi:DNA replication protein DnaC
MRFQKLLSRSELLIIDELGFITLVQDRGRTAVRGLQPTLRTQRHAVTSNLPFNECTEAFGSERLTGALLDHQVHILETNGESYRLKDSKGTLPPKPRS